MAQLTHVGYPAELLSFFGTEGKNNVTTNFRELLVTQDKLGKLFAHFSCAKLMKHFPLHFAQNSLLFVFHLGQFNPLYFVSQYSMKCLFSNYKLSVNNIFSHLFFCI